MALRFDSPASQFVAFIGGASLCVFVGNAAAGMLGGVLAPTFSMVSGATAAAFIATGLMVLSVLLLRRRGLPFASLGLPMTGGRLREFGIGFAISALLFLAVAWVQSVWVGARWEFQGGPGVRAALASLAITAVLVVVEEVAFRGVALRALREMYGEWPAIVLAALLFGAYHLVGSGDWGMGAAFRFLMPTLGGLLFGWVALRSGGLALPMGLHAGGNWVQAGVAGFTPAAGVSATSPWAVWRIPVTAEDIALLIAPDVLPRLPYLFALVASVVVSRQYIRSTHPPTLRTG